MACIYKGIGKEVLSRALSSIRLQATRSRPNKDRRAAMQVAPLCHAPAAPPTR
jgi:hypothetical protein